MRLPSLSVITPSFNCAAFIEDAVLSVARQQNVSVEHIIVDGASSDGTGEVVRKFPEVRWISEKDEGQSDAINKGFLLAGGELMGWLNADDYYLPGGLEAIARAAEEHPEAHVIYGDCVFVDKGGHIVRSKVEHKFDRDILMYFGCYIPSTSTFFRRRIIDTGMLLDREYRVCMDFEYFARLAYAGHCFHYVPKLIAAFRWHGSNISLQQLARRGEERHMVQQRFCGRKHSEEFLGWMSILHRGKRILRKAAEGNLLRELTLRRMGGVETLWQHRMEGQAPCANLRSL